MKRGYAWAAALHSIPAYARPPPTYSPSLRAMSFLSTSPRSQLAHIPAHGRVVIPSFFGAKACRASFVAHAPRASLGPNTLCASFSSLRGLGALKMVQYPPLPMVGGNRHASSQSNPPDTSASHTRSTTQASQDMQTSQDMQAYPSSSLNNASPPPSPNNATPPSSPLLGHVSPFAAAP